MVDDEARAKRDQDLLPGDRSALLVVRCWLEPCRDGASTLRGYVRDLHSGEEVPIAGLAAVEEQLRRRLGLEAPAVHDRRALGA